MNIQSITIRAIEAPLKEPFVTALHTVQTRESIILEVKDEDGVSGWGEVVAFSEPWYTEETIKTCLYILKEFLIPLIQKQADGIHHPNQLQQIFAPVRGHHMAKTAVECALWDLYAKQKNVPLYELFGGNRRTIETGVVVAASDIASTLRQIEKYVADGYKRYKIKVNPQTALPYVKAIRSVYPDLPLMVDANSSFSLQDIKLLRSLDEFRLMMIEQPLAHDDFLEHRILQKQLTTPICLDESITSAQTAFNACELESCQIICVKMGRVGGWGKSVQIHDYCVEKGIKLWCGGMIEFGISKAHNMALASLEGFVIPGDISSSNRFWDEDIIELHVSDGKIKLPNQPGIGFAIDYKALQRLTLTTEMILLKKSGRRLD